VEAACGATFLGEADNAERLLLTMLNHRHHLCGKRNWFEIQAFIVC
jgi:hypothetical protein